MMKNIFTVDVEDWFHILDFEPVKDFSDWRNYESRIEKNLKKILKICEAYGVKGTFFILGWIAENYPELIKLIHYSGHEIGCHSNNHQLVYELTETEFEEDLESAKTHIFNACKVVPRIYRAPGFSINPDSHWAFKALIKSGFEIDCSIFPAPRAHGGMPNYAYMKPHILEVETGSRITCLPMNYMQLGNYRLVYSGGGYFRALPRSVISSLMHKSDYNMTYFHPRDFDPNQPRLSGLSFLRRIKTYVGLREAEQKLKRLLAAHKFVSVTEYLRQNDDLEVVRAIK